MAYSVSVTKKSVFGDQRVHFVSAVADAAEGEITTGLNFVEHFNISPKSATTAAVKTFKNVLTSGTASVGTISISGAVSGDEFYLVVYGR